MIWVTVGSFVVVLTFMIVTEFGTPTRVQRRRRARQLTDLRELLVAQSGHDELAVDLIRFRDVPRVHIVEVLGQGGWVLCGQEILGKSWHLRFQHLPAEVQPDSRTRLMNELAEATVDANGYYRLNRDEYAATPNDEIREMVETAGWYVERPHPSHLFTLAIPFSDPSDNTVPAGGTVRLGTLRGNDHVLARAEAIRRDSGFDPLSASNLAKLRQDDARYGTKNTSRIVVAGIGWACGVSCVLLGVSGDFKRSSDGYDFPLYFIVAGCALFVVALLFTITAWRVCRQRTNAIGDRLSAVKELNRVHRRTSPSGTQWPAFSTRQPR